MTTDLKQFSLKIANFKCFGNEPQGFERIAPFNIIIGRNNSGKSALLDMFSYVTQNKFGTPKELWHDGEVPQFHGALPMDNAFLKRVCGPNHPLLGLTDWIMHRQMHGKDQFRSLSPPPDQEPPFPDLRSKEENAKDLASQMPNPLKDREFRRIHAERNIEPEEDQRRDGAGRSDLTVNGNGSGITNIIQSFINKADLPSDLVEKILLGHLNTIVAPDTVFTRIVAQQLKDQKWEIYLEEKLKGRIALSQSGSGLKTIIIVLVHILLLPRTLNKKPSEFIFGCEELENNLHPALLRRLLNYLFEHAKETGALFFLTTHSSVAIDLFSRDSDAQIIHVTHNGKDAQCRTVKTYVENRGVLDDLDVRASDLLQANGIIWVEGPSDRIYINHWIDLHSKGKLKEGTHYQCVFYGGRLLAHLSGDAPDDVENGIALLRVNRNCCLVADSDKKASQTPINATKKRIQEEIEALGGQFWVTKGKEIENYVPATAISEHLDVKAGQVGQYEPFDEYLNDLKKDTGKQFKAKKAIFAEQIVPRLSDNDCLDVLDLRQRIEDLCGAIREWNGIGEQSPE